MYRRCSQLALRRAAASAPPVATKHEAPRHSLFVCLTSPFDVVKDGGPRGPVDNEEQRSKESHLYDRKVKETAQMGPDTSSVARPDVISDMLITPSL